MTTSWRDSELVSVVRNAAANVVIRGVFGIARIVLLLVIAKVYGATQFGTLSIVLSLIEIFKVVADLGMDVVSIRRHASAPDRSHALLENVLGAKIVFASIAYLAAPVTFWILYSSLEGLQILLIAGVSLYSTLLINAFVSVFQARLSLARMMWANLAGVAVYAGLSLAGIAAGQPVSVLVVAIPVGELATLALVWRLYAREHPVRIAFRSAVVRDIASESFLVGLAGLVVTAYARLDILLLGLLAGEQRVGEYAVAVRLIEPAFLLFSSVSISFYAFLSGSRDAKDPARRERVIRKVFFAVTVLALSLAVGITLFHAQLLGMLSAEYQASGAILEVLGWSLLFRAWNPQLTAVLNSLGKFRIMAGIAIANLVLCIGLNLVLIPRYGVMGAAVAIIAVEGWNMIVQISFVSHYVKGFMLRLFAR